MFSAAVVRVAQGRVKLPKLLSYTCLGYTKSKNVMEESKYDGRIIIMIEQYASNDRREYL